MTPWNLLSQLYDELAGAIPALVISDFLGGMVQLKSGIIVFNCVPKLNIYFFKSVSCLCNEEFSP